MYKVATVISDTLNRITNRRKLTLRKIAARSENGMFSHSGLASRAALMAWST